MLEAGARDRECKLGWESIAGNPVATREAFETLLFTGGNDKLRLLQESARNPGFPPGLASYGTCIACSARYVRFGVNNMLQWCHDYFLRCAIARQAGRPKGRR